MGKISEILSGLRNWFEFHKKEVVFAVIIFLVASVSFGLGYLVNREFNRTPIIIEKIVD